jgi:Ca2+-binding RTX toxin-like protein
MTRRIVLAAALLLAAPASANAATLTKTGSTLVYAGGGAPNTVTFTQTGADVTVTAADGDPISPSGCGGGLPGTFICTGITAVVASGNGGNDALDASGLTTARATLSGGDGDDALTGGGAADSISGGAGIDSVAYATAASVSLNDLADDGAPNERDNVRSDVEDVTVASGTLVGSAAGNTLHVVGGGGTITGGDGSDTLEGSTGDDTINARDGFADRVFCDAGTDTVTADQLDQVYSNCENVTRQNVVGGADDRPPVVTWSAPASGAELSANSPSTLAADVTDDHGVARVEFYDDERLVCSDDAAPYTCAYAPRGADVGRDTLIARAVDSADQATSVVQAVTVGRFAPKAFTLKLSPSRDRKAPYKFNLSGKLTLPDVVSRSQGCNGGQVSISVKAGSKTVATRRATLSRVCEYRLRVTFNHRPSRKTSRLKFSARFAGNDVMSAKSASSRTGRTR